MAKSTGITGVKLASRVGGWLALAGLALFLSLPWVKDDFQLNSKQVDVAIPDENHRTAIREAGFDNKTASYSSMRLLMADYTKALNTANEKFRQQQAWDKVIYTDYRLPLAREAVTQESQQRWQTLGWLAFALLIGGGLLRIVPEALGRSAGIDNTGVWFRKSTARGLVAFVFAGLLIAFYILLYQVPHYLVAYIEWVSPLSNWARNSPADRWFLYGFLYTVAMLVMGLRMALHYRHSNYQLLRTTSVVFFQLVVAFSLPHLLSRLNQPAYDVKSIWPLEYSFFFDYRLDEYMQAGTLGIWLLGWGIALALVGVPLLTYFFGKRWYCSWVCGCGGLAETAGDPYRHLSDKRLVAWQVERYLIHGVLVFAVVMTGAVLYTYFNGTSELLGINTYDIRSAYGFYIGFVFAGAIGTGFYPVMGNRVWCRFGCPLAAYLGLVQRFKSRFRITTNGGQCISCGNCSTYCEMGIDVRWYAQRGQNIVRSSCVGCGICAAVCPRGVLKLENGSEKGRINDNPILIGHEGARLNPRVQ